MVASRLQLPPGPWATVLDGLCARFPAIPRDAWIDRFARGRVLDAAGAALAIDAPYRTGAEVRYFREVVDEPAVPFAETVLHADADLVVADKPHFLPVTPAGGFVRETLLARLVQRLGNPDLVPLHRIDRDTAGLVLFSASARTRAAYQALFRERRIRKHYEAIAPALAGVSLPLVRKSRIVPGTPFFRMQEVDGVPNSETRISVLERGMAGEGIAPDAGGVEHWRYALEPVTGRKHQLRVHMAALGAPIANDRWYPQAAEAAADDHARPLKLLARRLSFQDPVNGLRREFESALHIQESGMAPAAPGCRRHDTGGFP
jgi:tRNA pseudouridine32 synthase/23S rRNA pseudouridine746 synthase